MKKISVLAIACLLFASCSNLKVAVQGSANEFDPLAYGYTGEDERDIRLNGFNIPLVPVTINDYETWLELDFGSGNDVTLTSKIQDKIDYTVSTTQNTYWSDGRVRGTVQKIIVDRLSVYGETRTNQECTLADWKIYSSFPFNGLLGLQVFLDKRISVDYLRKKMYVSKTGLPETSQFTSGTSVIPLIDPPDYFPSGVFIPGRINGNDTIVYIDSGNSETAVNGKYFRTVPKEITLDLGGQSFMIQNYHVEQSIEFQNYRNGIGIVLGSDFLKNCVITIDRAGGNRQLILQKE